MAVNAADRDAQRAERKAQAAKHSALMKGAFASDTAKTVDAAVIYEDGQARTLELSEAAFEGTETVVTTAFAPEALFRFGKGKTMVVDPASATRPGGAYEDGAFGPEQVLCAESNLYEVLQGMRQGFHQGNRGTQTGMLFTDRAAYLPDVAFLRGGTVRKADVLAIPEPVRARALENHRSERECDLALANRVESILRAAAANGCETVVVGAFGCGRNGYPASQIVSLFQDWIAAHSGAIGQLVFAVPRAFADQFREAFGQPEPEVAPVVAAPEAGNDSDSDEFDWRSVELPEGITVR